MRVKFKLYKENKLYEDRILYDFEAYVLEVEDESEAVTEYIQTNYSTVLTPLHHQIYRLRFENRVGWVDLFGETYRLLSRKWDEGKVHQLWISISRRLAALPFHYLAESKQRAETLHKNGEDSKYHQWVFFRDQVLYQDVLRHAWHLIEQEPHQHLVEERFSNDAWLAANMTETSYINMITDERLIGLSESHPLHKTNIAQQLQGKFPTRVTETRKMIYYDTNENRWIKWLIAELLELTEWMKDYLQQAERKRSIHRIDHLKEDNQQLQLYLNEMLTVPWLAEVGRFHGQTGNSTVLQRKQGYRHWFDFYQRYLHGRCYPVDPSVLKDMVETKKISKMFEYWCFFEILEAVECLLPSIERRISFVSSAYSGASLQEGAYVKYQVNGSPLVVYYNKTFVARKESYSVELRPDISLHWKGSWYHFDAKFKNTFEDDFLRDDLNKMHVYRDAIPNTKSAIAMYPAVINKQKIHFFSTDSSKENSGIGSISLDIAQENTVFQAWIKNIFS